VSLTAAVDARCLGRPGIGFYAVVRAIVDELAADGWRVVLVTDKAEGARRLGREYPAAEVVLLPRTTWLWWEQVQVARWLARRRPDLWVAPTNYGVPLFRPSGVKSLLVVHDLIPLLYPRTYLTTRPLWAAMYLVSLGTSLLRADFVASVSDASAHQVYRFCRRRAPVSHPPVPERLGARPPSPLKGQRFVVFNGGFDSRKNVPQLLEAFGLFRASPEGTGSLLVIMGDRDDLARAMLAEHGLEAASVVTGYVAEEDKWAYLANAVAVAYPSSYEGFGIVATEAFAAGVPLVCGTGGALAEVGGEAAIFVDPARPSSIAEGLRRACDPAVRETAVAAGYRQLEMLRQRSGGWAVLARSLAGPPDATKARRRPRPRQQPSAAGPGIAGVSEA
jgi:glycosyltransferase involved in cell wall biosynthesis